MKTNNKPLILIIDDTPQNIHSMPGTAKEKGTGLGLILCKEFVEKHEGTIWAESMVKVGSEFKFTIPKTIIK